MGRLHERGCWHRQVEGAWLQVLVSVSAAGADWEGESRPSAGTASGGPPLR